MERNASSVAKGILWKTSIAKGLRISVKWNYFIENTDRKDILS